VFLEMPGIMPVMQLHVRMQWETADGEAFKAELYPTVKKLGEALDGFELGPEGKRGELAIAVSWPGESGAKVAGDQIPGRPLTVGTLSGLRYDTKELRAKAGERLSLTLKNTDVIPHNLVLVRPDTLQTVGNLANQLIADPKGIERHYVPDSDAVIDYLPVIGPGESATMHFNAPVHPGEYPYLCTFPGHWMLMNGKLIVEP